MKKYIKPEAEAIEIDVQNIMLVLSDTAADPNIPVKSKRLDAIEPLDDEEEE